MKKQDHISSKSVKLRFIAIGLALLLFILLLMILPKDSKTSKSTSDVNTDSTAALEQKTVEDTSKTPKASQNVSNEPQEPIQQTTAQDDPEPPAPTPIWDLTKQYALSQGESEHQAGCFYAIVGHKTGWNITEEVMHDKFASLKAAGFPTFCFIWDRYVANYPPDNPLKGWQ